MRIMFRLAVVLACLGTPTASAQSPPGVGEWLVGLTLDAVRFGESLTDTAAASNAAAGLRPDGRLGLGLLLGRQSRSWRVDLQVGWASGRVEAGNAAVAVRDKTSRLVRWRLAGLVGRRLASVGLAEVTAAVGPTLDCWSVEGSRRLRVGAETRLALRVPLGPVELENHLGLGVSESPFQPGDAGPGFRRRGQTSVTVGGALRAPL